MELKKRGWNRGGFVSSICFLMVFSVVFLLMWHTIELIQGTYREKLKEVQALNTLTAYDLRTDMFSVMNATTDTVNAFIEEVYINDTRIYLDENNEIIIERGE